MTHPITPPPELVQQWFDTATKNEGRSSEGWPLRLANYAAQWGADQELEACCEWLEDVICDDPQDTAKELRAARRPKPRPLREQAMEALERMHDACLMTFDSDIIRCALEALPDD